MHKEQYASKHGPAEIVSDGKKVEWTFNHGGQNFFGSELVDEHGHQAALHRARKAVDAFAHTLIHGKPAAEPSAAEPAVEEPAQESGEVVED